jgi:putative acetyltransferase
LRKGGQGTLSLVATIDDEVVGHVLFSPVTPGNGLGLAPVAVMPAHQRRGIAAVLIGEGLKRCSGYVVVLGDPAYYQRFGFRRARDFGLENEYGADEEFMVLEVQAGALRGIRGLVRYRKEFSVL